MGWLFTQGQTRAQLIHHLIRTQDSERAHRLTLAHCTKGNVLWTVREVTYKTDAFGYLPGFPQRYIGCDLMAFRRSYGWGYKDLCEGMGPLYYHCPLAYLALVPEANADWRAAVRHWHERQSRPIHVGDIWSLVPRCSVRAVEIVSVRPLRGRGRPDGVLYRIKRELLDFCQLKTSAESGPSPIAAQLPLPDFSSEQALAA